MKRQHSHNEFGQGLIEYALILVLILVALISILIFLISRPDWAEKAIIVVIIGGLGGFAAWAGKQTLRAATNRAQLRIMESLSSKGALSRAEIYDELAKEHFLFRLLPEIDSDAISLLVSDGKIKVIQGSKYTLTEN